MVESLYKFFNHVERRTLFSSGARNSRVNEAALQCPWTTMAACTCASIFRGGTFEKRSLDDCLEIGNRVSISES